MNEKYKLDYSLKTPQERIDQLNKLLSNIDTKLNRKTLEQMTDYIYSAMSSKEQKAIGLLSKNSLNTIKKREISFEGLMGKFENNEDMIYNLLANNKNIKLTHKQEITKEDIDRVPGMAELRAAIEVMDRLYQKSTGHDKYIAKKSLIDMRQEQYILKTQQIGGNPLIQQKATSAQARAIAKIPLDEHCWIDENQEPVSDGIISLFNPKHIAALLANYSFIKAEVETEVWDDFYYLMIDFDRIAAAALKDYPMYEALVTYKIDGLTHAEIADRLLEEFGDTHTPEYLSKLWRNKIPKLIADAAKREYLNQYYTNVEYGKWKKCSRCGQIKLAHSMNFSKNKTSKDGFYSICKECRNKKRKGSDLFNGGSTN